MRSRKFSLKICGNIRKFSAEIGTQCGKLNLKMLPVRADNVDEPIVDIQTHEHLIKLHH